MTELLGLSLGKEEENFRWLLESAPVAIVTVNVAGEIQYANPQLETMFGYTRNELLGQPIEILMPQRFRAIHVNHRADYMAKPRVRAMGSAMDLAGQHKDGTEFPIEAGLSYITMGSETLIMGSVTDISRRKEIEGSLEQAVRERTQEIERRRSVAEGLRYILAVLNSAQRLDKTLDYTVHQACRLMDAQGCALYELVDASGRLDVRASHNLPTGFASNASIPLPIGETTTGKSILHQPHIAISDIKLTIFANPAARQRQQLLLVHGYQALLAVQILIKDTLYGGLTLFYAEPRNFSAEDIQLAVTFADHAALAIDNARLREQVERTAVVTERNRIARNLHDSVTQTLFSANIIAEVLPKLLNVNPEEAIRRAEELRELARGALAEMRTLLLELRPAQLDEANIHELFQQLRDAAHARSRIPVTLNFEGDTTLSVPIKTALFYITQEALNNVAKHARANHAKIHLSINPDEIKLSIHDDGIGFDPTAVTSEHMGLIIMHERAAEIDARLDVYSQPEQGTQIRLSKARKPDDSLYTL